MSQDLNLDCISINETWLNTSFSDAEVSIPDFHLFLKDRTDATHGGVALYVRSTLYPTLVDVQSDTESLWLTVTVKSTKLLIATIYRTPNSHFNSILQDLEKASALNYDMVVMGDFNYGRSKVQFIEHSFLLKQIIDNPTRITNTSQTLIDHMFISNHLTPSVSGVLSTSFSDHLPVFLVLPTATSSSLSHKTVRKRSYNHFDYDFFISSVIHSQIFATIYNHTDVNIAWSSFKNEFLKISNQHAPIRLLHVKQEIVFKKDKATLHVTSKICENTVNYYN